MKTLPPPALHAVRWLTSSGRGDPWWSAWHAADAADETLCRQPVAGRDCEALDRSDDLGVVSCLHCQDRLARLP